MRILSLLIERSGRLVIRDDFQRELWPGGTFGDFENGLNAAVNRLRQALGDSAEQPRYIETVAGQGYRFIAPIQRGEPKPVLSMTMRAVDESLPDIHHPPARKLAWFAAFLTTLALGVLIFLRFRETASSEQRSAASRSCHLRNPASMVSNCRLTGAYSLSHPAVAYGSDRLTHLMRFHFLRLTEQPQCSGRPIAASSRSLRMAS